MGAKRLRRQYEVPKRLWDKKRIEVEKKLRDEYGLKNARELWKMQTMLRKVRREARRMLSGKGKNLEERKELFLARMKAFLVRKEELTLDDVLALTVRELLERRLQSIAYKRHLAKTIKQSRQFITHGHIAVNGRKVSSPSYLVRFGDEDMVGWWRNRALQLEELKKEEPVEPDSAGISDATELKAAVEKPLEKQPVASSEAMKAGERPHIAREKKVDG